MFDSGPSYPPFVFLSYQMCDKERSLDVLYQFEQNGQNNSEVEHYYI